MTVDEQSDAVFMRRALACAEATARRGEVPVGAVLTDAGGSILAEAGNAPIATHDATAHAEIIVLRTAGRLQQNYRLPGCTLYVTLEPCPMCASALVHARIARIVFATDDPKTGACGSVFDLTRNAHLNHQIEITAGVLADDAARLLMDFFEERRA